LRLRSGLRGVPEYHVKIRPSLEEEKRLPHLFWTKGGADEKRTTWRNREEEGCGTRPGETRRGEQENDDAIEGLCENERKENQKNLRRRHLPSQKNRQGENLEGKPLALVKD